MEKKTIRYEKTFDDGSTEFLDKENTENFLSNLALADGICLSRGYITFKPVVWTPSLLSEQKPSEGAEQENIISFLYGETAFKGRWFGETPHGEPFGKYWWRPELRKYLESERLKARNETIQECIESATEGGTVRKDLIKTLEKLKSKTI